MHRMLIGMLTSDQEWNRKTTFA